MKIISNLMYLNIIVFLLSIPFTTNAESIDLSKAKIVATNKIIELNKSMEFSILEKEYTFKDKSGQCLFYLFEFNPSGYMVISAETNLPPVIAYSFQSEFDSGHPFENPLVKMIQADLMLRKDNIPNLPEETLLKRNNQWNALLESAILNPVKTPQQWPPEGTTSTGGWLETNWTQGAPYNNFCPIDPVTNDRSIAGCPAVALAMIINYYETLNGTTFSDTDDYYHSYAGRNYWIDNDYLNHDFPSFPSLNAHLDTLSECFTTQTPLKENQKAAITFACGIAATQVYTSSISGTFGVSQAYDAYMKFGFEEAVLLTDNDTSLYTVLSQNMMDGRPVHLAVVDPPGTMGHNVVIDGYNTDDYYHLNFGWGGSYNGWYLLPDEIPYGLTVVEGAIANIAFPPIISGLSNTQANTIDFSFSIAPNPVTQFAQIEFRLKQPSDVKLDIYNLSGKLIQTLLHNKLAEGVHRLEWKLNESNTSQLEKGVYFCKLQVNKKSSTLKLIVQ
jgi:hypothetical protein